MEIKAILERLTQAESFSRSLPISITEQEEYLSFCSLQLFQGRDVKTNLWLLFVDFVRWNLGRITLTSPESRSERTSHYDMDEISVPSIEAEVIKRLDAQRAVRKIMSRLGIEEQLVLRFLFYDELTMKEVSEIFEITEAAVSLRVKKIFGKIKLCSDLANFSIDV